MNDVHDDPNKDLRDLIQRHQLDSPGTAFPCHRPHVIERVAKAFKDDLADGGNGPVLWCAGTWWQYEDAVHDPEWRRIADTDMAIMAQDFWRTMSDTPLTAKRIRQLVATWRTMPEFSLSRAAMRFQEICVQRMGRADMHDVLCIRRDNRLRPATDEDITNLLHRFLVT
jgi:hypothetical protein